MVTNTTYYRDTPIAKAELPKDKTVDAEVESGINICLYKLKNSKAPHNKILFDNVTVSDLKKLLVVSRDCISFTKSELGEDFFK